MLTAAPSLVPTFVLSQTEMEALTPKSDERRTSSRIADQATLLIAPVFGNEPLRSSFQLVVGKDVSAGGISFFYGSSPSFEELEIELGACSAPIHVRAQVVQSRPIVGLEPYYLVSCRFTGRSSPR